MFLLESSCDMGSMLGVIQDVYQIRRVELSPNEMDSILRFLK
jgi:hypothetical protein